MHLKKENLQAFFFSCKYLKNACVVKPWQVCLPPQPSASLKAELHLRGGEGGPRHVTRKKRAFLFVINNTGVARLVPGALERGVALALLPGLQGSCQMGMFISLRQDLSDWF